ncbi:MAG TPA: restriction endonuclease subunit S [Candidatus Micrarchaeia archaeon]|nr:restriction endonuclease subunit S [Candidatus Micrarchaeia archaeon]
MRDGWHETTLGAIAEVVGGGTPPTKIAEYWGGSIAWLTPTEVVAADGEVIHNSKRTITEAGLSRSAATLLPVGSVLVTSRATVGAVAMAGRPVATNQGFQSLVPGPSVLPWYLLYWAQAHKGDLQRLASGTIFPEVSHSKMLRVPVVLPPLADQRRIVDLIASVDAAVEATGATRETARAARAALLSDLFSGRRRLTNVEVETARARLEPTHVLASSALVPVDSVPDGWQLTTLGRLVTFASGFAFSDRFQGRREGIPFYKVSDMNRPENAIAMSVSANYVTPSALSAMRARSWPPGTVVFPKVGAALLTEKRRILSEQSAFDNNVMGLVAGDAVLPRWLLCFMQTVRFKDVVQQGAVPSVSQGIVGNIPVPLPPLDEQRRMVDVLASVDTYMETALLRHGAIQALRSALLADLLSGRHKMPASYDELVSA